FEGTRGSGEPVLTIHPGASHPNREETPCRSSPPDRAKHAHHDYQAEPFPPIRPHLKPSVHPDPKAGNPRRAQPEFHAPSPRQPIRRLAGSQSRQVMLRSLAVAALLPAIVQEN